MANTLRTGKLPRKCLMHFIDASFGGNSPSWFLLGKDIEDMSVEMNPDTEETTNILDETTTTDNGYKPSISADSYMLNPDDALYAKIKDIMMNRKSGGDCKTKILEVIVENTDASDSQPAWTEDVIVKPASYGGPTGGVSVPINISFDGNRKEGTVTFSSGVPTFAASL